MSVAVINYVAEKFNGNFKLATEWSLAILETFAGAENYFQWLVIERHSFNYLSILVAASASPSHFYSCGSASNCEAAAEEGWR